MECLLYYLVIVMILVLFSSSWSAVTMILNLSFDLKLFSRKTQTSMCFKVTFLNAENKTPVTSHWGPNKSDWELGGVGNVTMGRQRENCQNQT